VASNSELGWISNYLNFEASNSGISNSKFVMTIGGFNYLKLVILPSEARGVSARPLGIPNGSIRSSSAKFSSLRFLGVSIDTTLVKKVKFLVPLYFELILTYMID